jgi:6-pyruvoyltetrahydropterin/6-carboxytetrahydropterin synthase
MKWRIDKSFSFCYGHRVHNQTLNADYSEDSCMACRHLHGHEGLIKIHLESDKLERGMVTDFKHLNWFKTFLDNTLDHKFIMDVNDPLVPHEVPEVVHEDGSLNYSFFIEDERGFWTPNMMEIPFKNQAILEKYEGFIFVDFVPTSENLSAWLLEVAQNKMAKLGVNVVAIDYWETPKSHCSVSV